LESTHQFGWKTLTGIINLMTMNKRDILIAIRSLELRINYRVGTLDELEDAQVQLDMYIDMLDDLEEE